MLAAPLLAQDRGVDLVLLLETSLGMPQPIPSQQFAALPSNDRVAIMTFANDSRLRQPFTNDPKKLERALRQAAHSSAPHHWGTLPKTSPPISLLDSMLDAAQLFRDRPPEGRRRIILAIFGTEDASAALAPDEVKNALATAQIQLYAVALSKFDPLHARDSQIETPPTFPGRTPPVPTDRLPLPERTLKTLQALAVTIGGQAVSGEGKVPAILRRVQSR